MSKKADRTKNALLEASLEVMSRKGYAEATIGEIAKEAGVSKGLAYYHFKSKDQIAEEVLSRGLLNLVCTFEDIAKESQSARASLLAMLDAFCDLVISNWRFARFYLSVLWRDGVVWKDSMRAVEDRLIRVVAGEFERGQHAGNVRPDIDPEFAAVSSIGLVLTCSMRYYGMGDAAEPVMDAGLFAEHVRSFVINAVTVGA